ncbi:site-specific integrase [Pseudomonas azerbaijanoccidens]|uniref:site-specific integrase n=1 Tax=Pseudomonas azerbaijanoccidentalis TaxID=2842347 RepID=UPI00200AC62A|nr:site-specific integrase [Pseudomonas azerbaijanoccidentalis]MCK8666763.1 site-specific integrase [Pseudomonas azerbaijanoccidentalis]
MSREIFDIISNNPLSEDLFLDDNLVLHVKEHDARSDERKARPIDLKRYWLPANTVYETPSRFVECTHYFVALIYALDYFAASNPSSNSKCNRICFMLASLIKFFEHCWLNHVFDIGAISTPFALNLARSLAKNGWHEALDINSRLTGFLDTAKDPVHPIFTSTNSRVCMSSVGFQYAIATNIAGKEVAVYFDRVRQFEVNIGWRKTFKKNDKAPEGMKYSLLRQTLESINLLYHSIKEYRAKIVPYENYVRLAKELTGNPGATEDINSYDAGMLLEYSLDYINTKSDRTLRLLDFASKQLTRPGSVRKNLSRVMRFARRVGLVKADAVESGNVRGGLGFLNASIKFILNACFVVIAVFNARRKRELTHKKYGLSLGSGIVINEKAGIFLQEFYVEKTLKNYVKFYIASATKMAITILEKLQLIFINEPFKCHDYSKVIDRDLTLFRYRAFDGNGFSSKYSQFDFECFEPRMSGDYIFSAIGKPMRFTPHMFRRLYCKIFINRYEYFMLPFLSYQLQHEDISTTQIYVSNPNAQAESAELSKLYDWNLQEQSEALIIHNDEIMMK